MLSETIIPHPHKFMLAGNATFTVVSVKTGKRFTYRVRKPKGKIDDPKAPCFVSVLTGGNNEDSYSYAGVIWPDKPFTYRHGKKSKLGHKSPSVSGIAWLLRQFAKGLTAFDQAEIYHSGRCGRCGRKLTVPASIISGFGPECSGKVGF